MLVIGDFSHHVEFKAAAGLSREKLFKHLEGVESGGPELPLASAAAATKRKPSGKPIREITLATATAASATAFRHFQTLFAKLVVNLSLLWI